MGGTVGDIESAPFVEAMRQFQFRVGPENFALGHVSLVPIIGPVGEQKTKPTQATVRELRALGLSPDLVYCLIYYLMIFFNTLLFIKKFLINFILDCMSLFSKIRTWCSKKNLNVLSCWNRTSMY